MKKILSVSFMLVLVFMLTGCSILKANIKDPVVGETEEYEIYNLQNDIEIVTPATSIEADLKINENADKSKTYIDWSMDFRITGAQSGYGEMDFTGNTANSLKVSMYLQTDTKGTQSLVKMYITDGVWYTYTQIGEEVVGIKQDLSSLNVTDYNCRDLLKEYTENAEREYALAKSQKDLECGTDDKGNFVIQTVGENSARFVIDSRGLVIFSAVDYSVIKSANNAPHTLSYTYKYGESHVDLSGLNPEEYK